LWEERAARKADWRVRLPMVVGELGKVADVGEEGSAGLSVMVPVV
jgi:hypothetical protein